MLEAKIILKDGSSYLTPIENLDNVKRMMAGKYRDIEFPGYEELEEEEDTDWRAKYFEVFGKKPGNKSIDTMKREIEEETN